MSTAPATTHDVTSLAAHRAVRYAKFTIGYKVVEGIVAISAGAVAGAVYPLRPGRKPHEFLINRTGQGAKC